MKQVRVGNGCGFWGDNLDAPVLLADQGRLDYLTLEYLAELTMSILALQKQRDPDAGYAADFLDVLERLVIFLKIQPKLRIVSPAHGDAGENPVCITFIQRLVAVVPTQCPRAGAVRDRSWAIRPVIRIRIPGIISCQVGSDAYARMAISVTLVASSAAASRSASRR